METTQFTEPEVKSSFSFGSDSDDESYIQIELEPVSTQFGEDDDHKDGYDNAEVAKRELELRISFSSAVPLPKVSTDESLSSSVGAEKAVRSPVFSSSASEFSFSSAETTNSLSAPLATKPSKMQRTIKRRVQFPAVSRFLDTFLSSSRALSEMGDKPGHPVDAIQPNYWELVPSRKGSNSSMTKRRQGGMMMRFWMKLRSKNIGAVLESFLKPPQLVSASNRKNRGAEGFDKCLVQKERGTNRRKKMFGNGNNYGMFEANLGAGRGGGAGERRAKSCPGSTKTSPLHPGETKIFAGECSIQAAIAHCKRSCGQPSGFRF